LTLPPGFAATEKLLAVGFAQWSDGRAVDFPARTDEVRPLLDDVTKVAATHDRS
jgi:hypothetical protein